MSKIMDSVSEAAAKKAAEATHKVLSGFKPTERLLVVGLGLIGLSIVSAYREEKQSQEDSRKSSKTNQHS